MHDRAAAARRRDAWPRLWRRYAEHGGLPRSPQPAGAARRRLRGGAPLGLAYGGDTLNTAVYLARLNPPARLAVDYVTALGDDPYSDAMIEMWRREGVGTGNVARLQGKLPGLYLIRVDDKGERRFFYYRSVAAARELFNDGTTSVQLAALPRYDLLY